MFLLLISFIAGILTVLAPCVLPVLPIIIGGAAQNHERRNPYIITASLAVAVVLFTLLLKFSTLFINIPPEVWSYTSGIIIIFFGLITIFPNFWDRLNFKLGLSSSSDKILNSSARQSGRLGDVLIGLSLGPVFSSCSPTYFLILATVLPQSFGKGIIDLMAYALGLSLVLLLISLLGQRFITRAKIAADPHGIFKRVLGMLFLVVGILIFTGGDKKLQVFFAEHGWSGVFAIEQNLLGKINSPTAKEFKFEGSLPNNNLQAFRPGQNSQVTKNLPRYREITNPSGFVNTSSIKIGDLIGKKVVIIDFMTYSCINCIRTFPYLNAWYDKYHSQGLEIIGIHTPEFVFEKNIDNVRKAMQGFGIKFPVVLDNDYGTWNAYSNNYWPRKYIIDIDGYIAFDHIGEGGYEETEAKIQELLAEKMARDNQSVASLPSGIVKVTSTQPSNVGSPETYFGAARNQYLSNGIPNQLGEQKLTFPGIINLNELNLVGSWNFEKEFVQTNEPQNKIVYRYSAQNVYFVASSETPNKVEVLRDGTPLTKDTAGSDIVFENGKSFLLIHDDRLYSIVSDKVGSGEHTLQFIINSSGFKAFTFTFG